VLATTLAYRPTHIQPLRLLAWRRPEWPWALLAGSVWIILGLQEMWSPAPMRHTSQPMQHAMGPGMSMGPHTLSASRFAWSMLMTTAMMLPATLPMLREISLQSIWARRYRSTALFLVGYLTVWSLFGAAALAIWVALTAAAAPAATLVSGTTLLGAAAWGLTKSKARCLKRCHRFLPLAPRGRAADWACLRFGVYHARPCVGVCWPLMLAMAPSHTLLAMLGVTVLLTWERLARLPRLRIGALLLAIGGTIIVVAA
jgi:predicted metal-binding membrane protein